MILLLVLGLLLLLFYKRPVNNPTGIGVYTAPLPPPNPQPPAKPAEPVVQAPAAPAEVSMNFNDIFKPRPTNPPSDHP